jgi:predicted DNA-binding transcriptional regulator
MSYKEEQPMDYIKRALGIEVVRESWKGQSGLPYYLLNEYDFEAVTVGSCQCLFLRPKTDLAATNTIRKHLRKIRELTRSTIVFDLQTITRQRRASFIDAKIPFVVSGKQLYLPFLGAMLHERCDSDISVSTVLEKLMPSSQMLLLTFLIGKNKELYLSDAANRFGISAMSISRAATQLERTGLVIKRNDGVRKYIVSDATPSFLFEKARPHLINPVRKTVYIDNGEISSDMFLSGLSALSEASMLNPPHPKVMGTIRNDKELNGVGAQLIDGDVQSVLHIWRYDPRLISGTNGIDALSLLMCLSDTDDERVEQALEELLREVL